MQTTNLKNFVEQQDNLNKDFAKLIQEYHVKKKELTTEDLRYITQVDPDLYNNKLQDLIPHYEVQVFDEPNINAEVEECYTFYSYSEAQKELEYNTNCRKYACIFSVNADSIPDGNIYASNFQELEDFWKSIPIKQLRKLYVEIENRQETLNDFTK